MDSWRTINGMDWLSPDELTEPDPMAEFGVVLAHGYAHESPAELGIGAAAAVMVARELARPRETADYRIAELRVVTEVNLQDTVIMMRGDSEALRLGALALDQMLQDPSALKVANLPNPRRFAWTGWSSELSAWLGMGSAALAAELESPWSGDPTRFQQFVRGLHPSQGRRAIAWTSDPELVGAAFRDASPSAPTDDRPLTWREPGPTAKGPGSVTSTYHNNLLSARLPTSRTHEVAVRLVARTLHRNLVEFTGLVAGLQLTVEEIGADSLYALRAVPHEGETDWFAVRKALLEALDASAAFPDTVLADEIDKVRRPESVSRELFPAGRAISALRSSQRPTVAELIEEFDTMTVADLRHGTQLVQAASLLGVPQRHAVPEGRPLRRPAALAAVERPSLTRRSLVRLQWGAGSPRQSLRATTTTLEQTLKPVKNKKHDPLAAGPRTSAVDLTAVVARLDYGGTYTTLVDNDNRRLTLAWPAYRRSAPLRAIVDAATPPPSRIALPDDAALDANLRQRLLKRRTGLIVQVFVVVFLLALLIGQPVTGRRYQQPVVTLLPVGSVVTLGNGSTVQVSGASWRAATGMPRQYLVADVRYCGGGVTVDRNTGDDARNYVTPERFAVSGIAPASRRVLPLLAGDVPLQATQLAQGQCAEGKIGFEVDAATPPPGTQIDYHNGSGDHLQWSVS